MAYAFGMTHSDEIARLRSELQQALEATETLAQLARAAAESGDLAEVPRMVMEAALMAQTAAVIGRHLSAAQQRQPPPPNGPEVHGNGNGDPAST